MNVRRFEDNPIIRPDMLPGDDGDNINGPSLIRSPEWLPGRLGNYYLYFAHHHGTNIRLAYADDLEGPWIVHAPGTLKLSDARGCKDHIASPDVHVDNERQEIRMYFHGPSSATEGQHTLLATSNDGLNFHASDEILGPPYFRAFQWKGHWYAMSKGGLLHRSKDGITNFEVGHNPFPGSEGRDKRYNKPGCRHVAVSLDGEDLWVYYSNIGDTPERILRGKIALTEDWPNWKLSSTEEVVQPELNYEGVDLPITKSAKGAMKAPENSLRDPFVFVDEDGKRYLLYTVAGESGIAIAELS